MSIRENLKHFNVTIDGIKIDAVHLQMIKGLRMCGEALTESSNKVKELESLDLKNYSDSRVSLRHHDDLIDELKEAMETLEDMHDVFCHSTIYQDDEKVIEVCQLQDRVTDILKSAEANRKILFDVMERERKGL